MKKPIVPTPYGDLQFSPRRVGNVVLATVSGAIRTTDDPRVLGESISLDYRLDPSSGWLEISLLGEPWIETPAMTIKPSTREIRAIVEAWLVDHRAEVMECVARTLRSRLDRQRRKLEKQMAAAAAELRAEEAFLESFRG